MFSKIILLSAIVLTAVANEGVSTQIDASRLNAVMEWVENSKYTLDTELDNIQRSAIPDQESLYADVMGRILTQSGDKPNEFLMRNVLYRTRIVYDGLRQTPESPKRNALARRVLRHGVKWAQRLYEPDMNLIRMQREGTLTDALRGVEFAKLGVEWAEYMLSLYYSAPTNEVKLQLMKDMMGIMYNDINNDDAVNRILAPISGAIVTKNSKLSETNPSNSIARLVAARDLRRFMEQQLGVAKELLIPYGVHFASREIVVSTQHQPQTVQPVLVRITTPPRFTGWRKVDYGNPEFVANHKACRNLYMTRINNESAYDAAYATSICEEKALNFNFINNHNFNYCYSVYSKDYNWSSPNVTNQCLDKSFNFLVNRRNFEACYSLYTKKINNESAYDPAYAASTCVEKVADYDFTKDTAFKVCYANYAADYNWSSPNATNKCLEHLPRK